LLSINPSITLAFFQLFRSVLLRTRVREAALAGKKTALTLDLKPWEAFFVGATATSIGESPYSGVTRARKLTLSGLANTILYPLILAKKRLQVATGKSSATLFSVLVDAYSGKSAHGEDSISALPKGRSKGREPQPTAGVEGVYQGLQMQLLKGFFNQGVTFLVKGR
jgi:solute carrier family 25 (peroxisomal adenine nucleotide transporter), member 17